MTDREAERIAGWVCWAISVGLVVLVVGLLLALIKAMIDWSKKQ